jgi:hypothetical protein
MLEGGPPSASAGYRADDGRSPDGSGDNHPAAGRLYIAWRLLRS